MLGGKAEGQLPFETAVSHSTELERYRSRAARAFSSCQITKSVGKCFRALHEGRLLGFGGRLEFFWTSAAMSVFAIQYFDLASVTRYGKERRAQRLWY